MCKASNATISALVLGPPGLRPGLYAAARFARYPPRGDSVPPTRRQQIHDLRWVLYLLFDHPAIGFGN